MFAFHWRLTDHASPRPNQPQSAKFGPNAVGPIRAKGGRLTSMHRDSKKDVDVNSFKGLIASRNNSGCSRGNRLKGSIVRVELKKKHLEFLSSSGFLSGALMAHLENVEWISPNRAVLDLEPGVVLEFGDELSDQLMMVGFNENYEPTLEGLIIEDLIDLFRTF
jgi:hypothetical protein